MEQEKDADMKISVLLFVFQLYVRHMQHRRKQLF